MIISVLTICFAILCANLESYIWHVHTPFVNTSASKSSEIHKSLVLIRLFVAILLIRYVHSFVIAIACLGLFFYIHQSALYFFRNKLNNSVYTDGWNADGSSTSESYLDRKFPFIKTNKFRVIVFVFSMFLLIYKIFL